MIWGWIIGLIILAIIVLGGIGLGIYIYFQAKDGGSAAAPKTAQVTQWDGKSTLTCGGNDAISVTGVNATAGIKAGANCQVTLVNVNITAPVAIDASGNAKVTMTGGSINASTSSVVAGGLAKVDLIGTKVTGGKSKANGGAKITGAP